MTEHVLMLVTDPARGIERTIAVVRAAATAVPRFVVQHRDKTSADAVVLDEGQRLREAAHEAGARFVANDRFDALADGIHLPSRPRVSIAEARARARFVSVAVHDEAEAHAAIDAGASAILVSPIFTSDKLPARGLRAIQTARTAVTTRSAETLVLALGGIDVQRAASCYEAGADGVAVIRALYDAHDVGATARALALGT